MTKNNIFPKGFSVKMIPTHMFEYKNLCKEYSITYSSSWCGSTSHYGINSYNEYISHNNPFGGIKFRGIDEFRNHLRQFGNTNKVHEIWS